ncbi:aminoglycoside phosphotransferase [Phreatobacter stygius]|uniref:Aminoglycoside phosphotransferase n=1 Tax=Phreatobacter stygius TaxID=1940610 RepID=A0A4D7B4A7_9HYPH|nr:aminoglycoside phosphotransferase [Phreatobacter stygius]QCI63002.1 aminoglycoside phosphotransferase [Phreatobacter stygius]
MTTHALPKAAEAEQLTEALRRSGVLGKGRVADVVVERSFATILSHIFQLRLTYEAAEAGAPGSLILKAGLIDRPGGPWPGGRQEVAFYQAVAPATPAGLVPRCFDAHADPDSGAWHLLLEDLTETHIAATQWPLPPTSGQCERIVRTRAHFQAAWWDDPRLGASVGAWDDAGAIDQAMQRLAERFARFADDLGDRLSAERRALYERLLAAGPRLMARYQTRRHMTIVQGDAHVWNCFLARAGGLDDARLFDWDSWRVDVGSDDLAYMMAVHWYPELRQRLEHHLLDCFHDELTTRGVQGYDRRALQDDYRLSVLWQVTTPIWQHASKIPPVIWWNNLERIHLAVDDLHCHDLLAG